jgi:hypothetical protein
LRKIPKLRIRELLVNPPLNFRLIIDRVEANYTLEEDVELGMALRILSHFEQRSENV